MPPTQTSSDLKQWESFSSQARPMTRYLPNRKEEFDLRAHVESSGHSVDTCPYVILTEKMCKGHLVKMGGKIKSWKKRWFVFDRLKRNFSYYVGEHASHTLMILRSQGEKPTHFMQVTIRTPQFHKFRQKSAHLQK